MFNLFKYQQGNNPISSIFKDLTINQRMSIMNLLSSIAFCDGLNENQDKVMDYLNTYFRILNVRYDNCMQYHKTSGFLKIFEDLRNISKEQKEFLVIIAWELMICDGRPGETEIQVTVNIFEKIGISQDNFMEIIKKTQAIMNHLNK